MKGPRRLAKKVVRRPKKSVKRKAKPAQRAKVVEEMTADDAAVFDLPKAPAGMAYQWASTSRVEYMLMKGWSRVPYSRHPELPRSLSFDGYIVYHDNALFQIGYDLYVAERSRLIELARDMDRDFHEAIGRPDGRGFFIMPPSFVVSSDYERVPSTAPPAPVSVLITVMAPASWLDAASALNLNPGEYTRRRLSQQGFLLTADEKATFHPYELTTRKVD